MKLPFINEGIFEPYKGPVGRICVWVIQSLEQYAATFVTSTQTNETNDYTEQTL